MNYPQITLAEWKKVGEGFNSEALESNLHPGIMLKMVRLHAYVRKRTFKP